MMIFQLATILLNLAVLSTADDSVVNFSIKSAQGEASQPKKDHSAAEEVVRMTVNLQQTVHTIGSHFVGVTLDSQQIRYNWNGFDFSSVKVQNMAGALAPTYFRLGGTAADYMTYDLTKRSDDKGDNLERGAVVCGNFTDPFNMTGQDIQQSIMHCGMRHVYVLRDAAAHQWDTVNTFLQKVGWDLIMDLNALKRKPDGSWDFDNAQQLLQYSADRNYTIAGFELGNEYDLYPAKLAVSPAQLATDYFCLRGLLLQFGDKYYSSFIVGPETAGVNKKYFQGFLQEGPGYQTIRASSFHQYYFSGKEENLSHFTDITVMDKLGADLDEALKMTHDIEPDLPVWLSETSTAYGCGTANISDRFVAGFLWLDKLGLSAEKGIQTVIRQTFYGFNYGLLDLDLNPNPDFWLTVLYKAIVRGSVFRVTTDRSDVRAYAACANHDYFKAGSLVLYFLNPNDYPMIVDMMLFNTQPQLVFLLTAGDSNGLLSKFSALNGVKLEMKGDQLPQMQPRVASGKLNMEPYSFGFVVLPEAKVQICLEQH